MDAVDKVKRWCGYDDYYLMESHEWKDNLFVSKLLDAGFDYVEIALVIDVLESTCNHCFDAPSGCRCWDDS